MVGVVIIVAVAVDVAVYIGKGVLDFSGIAEVALTSLWIGVA
jgi:hypothetical protein